MSSDRRKSQKLSQMTKSVAYEPEYSAAEPDFTMKLKKSKTSALGKSVAYMPSSAKEDKLMTNNIAVRRSK